jgi:hypothetical protein
MRNYGKVHTSFWTSENIRSLSEDGRTLAMYLLTCEHGTIAGVFRLPDGYVSDDLQWSFERVSKGFAELKTNGFATRCERTKWVFVHKYLEWNRPENPNQRKSVEKIAERVPSECSWKLDFAEFFCKTIHQAEPKNQNPSETVSEPFLNQEQEQEQEQDNKKPKQQRGSRLPSDWKPSDEDLQFCKTERPELNPRTTADGFRDYWLAQPGAKGLKLDWSATWRNWVRRSLPSVQTRPAQNPFAGVI